MTRVLSAALLVAATLGSLACGPKPEVVPCGADQQSAYFDLDAPTKRMLGDKNAYFAENPPAFAEDKANNCCSFWNDSVAAFCQTKVDAFCNSAHCSSQTERERCSRVKRELVKQICLQAAVGEYQKLIPICAPIRLTEQTTSWPNQQGKLVACPCAEPSCEYQGQKVAP